MTSEDACSACTHLTRAMGHARVGACHAYVCHTCEFIHVGHDMYCE